MQPEPFTVNDLSGLKDIQPVEWPSIVPAFEFYTSSPFCYPIKICEMGQMIGTGCCIQHHHAAWLAHIIVSPMHRKKGIGQYITESLIRIAQSKYCTSIVLIATELGAPLYQKLGFITETEYLFYKEVHLQLKDPNNKYIFAFKPGDFTAIEYMDSKNSGEERMMHLLPHLKDAMLFKKGNQPEGFYLPSLGEGLIIAETPEAGTALMAYRLAKQDTVVFPQENAVAKAFMNAQAYKPFRKAKRMWLGNPIAWNKENLYNRIGGNLG